MSRMRQTVTHTSSHTANHQDHESNLDALLEDLQTTVSRSNSQLNLNGGTMTTGYREIRRTVTDGTQQGTVSDYQIEYLNPANTTHHVLESANHNGLQNQRNMATYKEYNYATSERAGRNDAKLKQNISELDSLLEDLNTAQKKSFAESSTLTRNISGIDSGLLEPVQTSTPQNRIIEQKHYREERVSRGRSTSPRRELVFTGPRSRDPSPIARDGQWDQGSPAVRQQQFYRYEKTTSTRTTGPNYIQEMNAPIDQNQTLRSNLAIEDSSLRGRSPSPAGNRMEYHYANTTTRERDAAPLYANEKVTTYRDHDSSREYSPQRYIPSKTTSSYAYSSTSKEVRSSEMPRSPQPHRSPSPMSYPQPPIPAPPKRGPPSYNYESQPPQSPQLPQKFSPSDPSNRLTYNITQQPQSQTAVSSYKYSSTTTNNYQVGSHGGYPGEDAPLLPRPFPTPSPTPEQQQPPKKLDELMASFSDGTELRNRHNTTTTTVHRYDSDRSNQALIPNGGYDREREKEKEKLVEKDKTIVKKEESKNVEGPPVYYPPGVELFSKKEETMSQQQSGGGMYKAKAKYEYEAKSKSKHKESSGKAVVPVCLPVCCAMPCTIM